MPSLIVLFVCLLLWAPLAGAAEPETPSLREAFADSFDIGTALGADQLLDPQQQVLDLVSRQFSVLTPENAMKWEAIHPTPERYDFTGSDALVEFAKANDKKVIGHTLVWHSQCPDWVFEDDGGETISSEALLARLREHMKTVLTRYKGRIQGWDVVNEAIEDDGSWRDTKWRQILGDNYIDVAFQMAHEIDPKIELYYNDYNMYLPAKRKTVCDMIRSMKQRGVPIDGVGLQGHWGLVKPSEAEIDAALTDYSTLGVKVMITELDINVLVLPWEIEGADVNQRSERRPDLDPYTKGLPPEVQKQLAERYASIFRLFLKHRDTISRVTFWGVHDGQTWHNNWPVPGRTAHSLLFDRELAPKPAFWGVVKTAKLK